MIQGFCELFTDGDKFVLIFYVGVLWVAGVMNVLGRIWHTMYVCVWREVFDNVEWLRLLGYVF